MYVCLCNCLTDKDIEDLTVSEFCNKVRCGKCKDCFCEKKNVMIKLFIDDIRMPADVGYNNSEFYVVRCWFSARQAIMKFKPQFISFDHDLGEDSVIHDFSPGGQGRIERTGYDIAKWMVEQDGFRDAELFTENFQFNVHSANPVGAENIRAYLTNYMDVKYGDKR